MEFSGLMQVHFVEQRIVWQPIQSRACCLSRQLRAAITAF